MALASPLETGGIPKDIDNATALLDLFRNLDEVRQDLLGEIIGIHLTPYKLKKAFGEEGGYLNLALGNTFEEDHLQEVACDIFYTPNDSPHFRLDIFEDYTRIARVSFKLLENLNYIIDTANYTEDVAKAERYKTASIIAAAIAVKERQG